MTSNLNVARRAGETRAEPVSKAAQFRALLNAPELDFLMEAHNGLSAKIVEEAGFKGIWASGLSISSALGVRDSNEASWTQVLEVLEFMSDATGIPILVDGDTGYGNFNNVRRLVQKLGQRDIAAVCIEDKLFPKTNSFIGQAQPLADIAEFCGKIKAGKDSQLDEDFSIIARVEALISGWGMEEALKRAEAYHAAGADGILIHSKMATADEILTFAREWGNRAPVVIVPTMYYRTPTDAYREHEISLAIWANHNLRAALSAMRAVTQRIKDEESLVGVEEEIASVRDVFDIAGNKELAEAERRYLEAAERKTSAIVLAASRGSKLGKLTEDKPKGMVDVRGEPLLKRLVGTLREAGVGDVTVVRGWKKDAIDLPSISTADNDAFATTGEVASLACAADKLAGDVVVGYGDILFRRFVLDALNDTPGDIVLAVDALSRGRDAGEAERLVDLVGCSRPFTGDFLDDEPVTLTRIGNDLAPDQVDAEWVGLARLSETGAARVAAEIEAMRGDGSLAKASLLDLFQRLLDTGETITVVYVTGHWFDVDDAFDLAKARNLM
ncbi:MAG: phosphoenolpyruvate mutase [Alphaproteobacteria bacterium]